MIVGAKMRRSHRACEDLTFWAAQAAESSIVVTRMLHFNAMLPMISAPFNASRNHADCTLRCGLMRQVDSLHVGGRSAETGNNSMHFGNRQFAIK